ncbi:MAG: hypothetical protein J6X92_06640 [Bacteroidales bacterium]|nr:hypothetical protein [Bacteroidales bacterium]
MKIGLVDIDSHNFPNLALMKISGWHKANGDDVEWAYPFVHYDRIYKSKVFTFSKEDMTYYNADEIIKGGTGYDIKGRLPKEIEDFLSPDYSIYPNCEYSIQFYSRGCIRHCPFCLVHDKEGKIRPVEPMDLNPKGKWIEVLDNNFFANPEWRNAYADLKKRNLPVKFHGVDVRIIDEEQAACINKLKLKGRVHIAWDDPNINLTKKLETMVAYIKPYKITCYVLVGFNSTKEQDMFRIETLRRLGISPFVMPFRSYDNDTPPSEYAKDLARYVNNKIIFNSCEFKDFEPRKGFRCSEYFIKNL